MAQKRKASNLTTLTSEGRKAPQAPTVVTKNGRFNNGGGSWTRQQKDGRDDRGGTEIAEDKKEIKKKAFPPYADPDCKYPNIYLSLPQMVEAAKLGEIKTSGALSPPKKLGPHTIKLYLDDGTNRHSRRPLTEFEAFSEYGVSVSEIEDAKTGQVSMSWSIAMGTAQNPSQLALSDAFYNRIEEIVKTELETVLRREFPCMTGVKVKRCARVSMRTKAQNPPEKFTYNISPQYTRCGKLVPIPPISQTPSTETKSSKPIMKKIKFASFENMPKQTPGRYIMYVVHDHLNFTLDNSGIVWVSLATYTHECLYKEPEEKVVMAARESNLYQIQETEEYDSLQQHIPIPPPAKRTKTETDGLVGSSNVKARPTKSMPISSPHKNGERENGGHEDGTIQTNATDGDGAPTSDPSGNISQDDISPASFNDEAPPTDGENDEEDDPTNEQAKVAEV